MVGRQGTWETRGALMCSKCPHLDANWGQSSYVACAVTIQLQHSFL